MKARTLLIPLAAFAVTVTGVSAFNSDVLENAGLSDNQISAFEEAHELRMDGDRQGARDIIVSAGIDTETMENIREAMQEQRSEHQAAVHEAVENDDYNAFKNAVEGSPIAEIVTSEDDFELFVGAYELRQEGEFMEAREIMKELGFEGKGPRMSHRGMGDGKKGGQDMHDGSDIGNYDGGRMGTCNN